MAQIEVVVEQAGRHALFGHGQWPLLWSLSEREFRSRYRQSLLAIAWSLFQPILLVAVYAIFFKGILDVSGGGVPYLSFILAGLVPWRLVVSSLGATTTLTDNVNVITKVYFPRELVPLSHVVTALVDLAIGTVILVAVAWVQGYAPGLEMVALPLIYLLVVTVSAAAIIFAATLAVFIRDVALAMPMLLQLVFFASPIMYPPDQLPPWLEWLSFLNPFAVAVNALRDVMFAGVWPDWPLLLGHLVVAMGWFVASVAYVRSVEHRLVDVV